MKFKQIVLAEIPKGVVKETNLQVKDTEAEVVVQPGSHEVAVKLLYIGVEPYYRFFMAVKETPGFPGLYSIGQPIWGWAVGEVVMSANPEFEKGDTVSGIMKFSEYVVVPKGARMQKVDASLPLSYYLGVLGMPGFTAYVGLKLIGNPKSGEQVFVSAASGAVGQIVGQLAKVYGCRVVGSAGSDDKVELLKTEFGFDDAFNYKKEKDLNAALNKYLPNGIDIYYDNVGGETLDAALMHCNHGARIPICGAISQYHLEPDKRYGVKNLPNMLGKCIKMEGFVEGYYIKQHWAHYQQEMSAYLKEGKIKYKEHVVEGIEHFPTAFAGIMTGQNIGKSVVRV